MFYVPIQPEQDTLDNWNLNTRQLFTYYLKGNLFYFTFSVATSGQYYMNT